MYFQDILSRSGTAGRENEAGHGQGCRREKQLDAAIDAGAGEDTPPDAGQDGTTYIGGSQKALDAIKEFRRSVHAAQEENVKLSNTLLATMTATERPPTHGAASSQVLPTRC